MLRTTPSQVKVRTALVATLALMGTLSACGSSNPTSSSAFSAGDTSGASKCGLGNSQKAAGEPIKIAALVTKQAGLDGFTDATDMAQAYFDCVNDNGGINGRPIEYKVYENQTDPQVAKSLGTQLLTWNPMVIAGGLDVLDCPVNGAAYEKAGYMIAAASVTQDCYGLKNFSPVNIGAAGSSTAAAQYLATKDVKKIVVFTSNAPGADLVNQSVLDFAKSEGIAADSYLENIPIADANGLALKMVQAAGDGGGVVINFNPGETLKVLNAVTQQGLQDRVTWSCPGGCNDHSLVSSLGSTWDGKIGINAELALPSSDGPDAQLFRKAREQYAPNTPVSAYGELGFVSAMVTVKALLSVPAAELNKSTANAAIANVKNFSTDLLCKPYYFGKGLTNHLSNNWTRTVEIKDGKLADDGDCYELAATSVNHLDKVRAYEKSQGIS